MKREEGYFWVKWDNKWFVAHFDSIKDWHIPGILSIFSECDLEEIDERRITRETVSTRINEIQQDWDKLKDKMGVPKDKLFGLL